MRSAVVSLLVVSVAAVAACRSTQQPASTSPSPAPGPMTAQAPAALPPGPGGGPGGPGGPGGARRPRPSSAAMDTMRRGMITRMLADIAGRENEPAGRVYKNIELFKELPARALLDTMNSFGRALGTTCTGCHVPNDFSKDDKQNKKLAREMVVMTRALNAQSLPAMKNLDDDHPNVTCAMCHAGSGHPRDSVALSWVAPTPPAGPPGGPPPQRP